MCTTCVPGIYDGIKSLRTEVKDGCEPSCGSWKLNPGSLKEQQVLFAAEQIFQLFTVFKKKNELRVEYEVFCYC